MFGFATYTYAWNNRMHYLYESLFQNCPSILHISKRLCLWSKDDDANIID